MKKLAVMALILAGLMTAGLVGCEHGQRALMPLAEAQTPSATFRLPPDETDVVYLTIDDGPSPQTAELLEVLAEFDASATLFLHTDHIGDDDTLRAVLANGGHNLGHHMPTDRDWSADTPESFRSGFLEAHCRLASYGQAYSGHFRPPLGRVNEGLMRPVLEEFGIDDERPVVLATYLPWDAGGATELAWSGGNRLTARRYGVGLGHVARPGDIVVFHDGPRSVRTENSLISLRAFLTILDRRGLEARALPRRDYSTVACGDGIRPL